MKILVTGAAGFIGSEVAIGLLRRGDEVIGFDNLNDYYDVDLKLARLDRVQRCQGYVHVEANLADRRALEDVFKTHKPDRVVHLAAQAGVRYAAENPHVYAESNLIGFLHVLEGCRYHGVEHLVFASTSSVYGADTQMPYSEHQSTDHPLTFYAATKKANEMMAHSYAHLYGIPSTGLRFFTVYGPWGRPDMAPMLFAGAIRRDEAIKVFNHGRHKRSFTYIDDIVEGVIRTLDQPPPPSPEWDASNPDPATSSAPYRIFNIGHERSVELLHFIRLLGRAFGREVRMEMLPKQPGDVPDTEADVTELMRAVGYKPNVSIEEGVAKFARWHESYYAI